MFYFTVIFLLAFNEEVAKLLVAANELEMMNGEYAFITLDFTVHNTWLNQSWTGGRSWQELVALFDGTVNLSVKGPHGERYENFVRQFSEKIKANNISEMSIVSIVLLIIKINKTFSVILCDLYRTTSNSSRKYRKKKLFLAFVY